MTDPASSRCVCVIGAGPAGLFAAEIVASRGYRVRVFDQMPSVGRKLLMAGRSGLNLTHAEPLDLFKARYAEAMDWISPALDAFPPEALRLWAEDLGQACFTGSSGRIFPKAMKASPLLRAWLARLNTLGVSIHTRHRFTGWEADTLRFDTPDGPITYPADATLLALGGASWSRLGSDGAWATLFPPDDTAAFAPSNCGFTPDWSAEMTTRHEGAILHSVAVSVAEHQTRSDLTLTRRGLEGSALYALSGTLRDLIARTGEATIHLDLRPTLSEANVLLRLLAQRPRESHTNRLRKALSLDGLSRDLLKLATPKDASPQRLAHTIKALPIRLTGMDALDGAISTAGGLRRNALDSQFMLHRRPGVFAAGEMLDWEAPTGGYLLQGCFSTAFMAANGMLRWLERSASAIP